LPKATSAVKKEFAKAKSTSISEYPKAAGNSKKKYVKICQPQQLSKTYFHGYQQLSEIV
jgi:hypothetical protein